MIVKDTPVCAVSSLETALFSDYLQQIRSNLRHRDAD